MVIKYYQEFIKLIKINTILDYINVEITIQYST